jgi:hypothetical protein
MISHLSTKSQISLLAANSLIIANLHNSSIHCAYYACLQMVKYYLLTKCGYKEEKDLDNDFKYYNSKRDYKVGTHIFYIDLIYNKFKSMRLEDEATSFKKEIKVLQHAREDADYKPIPLATITESKDAVKKAEDILKLLKKL